MEMVGMSLADHSGKEFQLRRVTTRMVCAGVLNGRVFRQVGENSLYDIRVFNAAVRRLGHHPHRATTLLAHGNVNPIAARLNTRFNL